jgi:4-aminobutyrate aminotransferase-like enzyme
MVGCEFTNPTTGQPDADLAKQVVKHAFEESHLLLLTCGAYANTIRWIPPLVVSQAQINAGLTAFEQAMVTVTHG